MWDHYKKTLVGMQVFIVLATAVLFVALGYRLIVASAFFVMMQVGAVVGAWWGERLRARIRSQSFQ